MSNLELKALLEVSVWYLVFLGAAGISSVLCLTRYNAGNKQREKDKNKPKSLKVEAISKHKLGKVLKK